MSLINKIKKVWKQFTRWIGDTMARLKGGNRPPQSRDKTPMPITNFKVEIEP